MPPTAPPPADAVGQFLLTPRQVARSLGISERKLRDLTVPHGSLPAVRLGRLLRYRPDSVEMWADSQEQFPTKPRRSR